MYQECHSSFRQTGITSKPPSPDGTGSASATKLRSLKRFIFQIKAEVLTLDTKNNAPFTVVTTTANTTTTTRDAA